MRDDNQTRKYAWRTALAFLAAAWLIMIAAELVANKVPDDSKSDAFDVFANWIPGLRGEIGKAGSLVLLSSAITILGAGVGVIISKLTTCCSDNTGTDREPLKPHQ